VNDDGDVSVAGVATTLTELPDLVSFPYGCRGGCPEQVPLASLPATTLLVRQNAKRHYKKRGSAATLLPLPAVARTCRNGQNSGRPLFTCSMVIAMLRLRRTWGAVDALLWIRSWARPLLRCVKGPLTPTTGSALALRGGNRWARARNACVRCSRSVTSPARCPKATGPTRLRLRTSWALCLHRLAVHPAHKHCEWVDLPSLRYMALDKRTVWLCSEMTERSATVSGTSTPVSGKLALLGQAVCLSWRTENCSNKKINVNVLTWSYCGCDSLVSLWDVHTSKCPTK
jgi:hypothetical protein